MKIISEKVAYLQKLYFELLVSSAIVTKQSVPLSINEIMNTKSFMKHGNKDFIKITNPLEIEFLKKLDWIIDYNEYISKDVDDIINEITDIKLNIKKLNDWFASLSKEEQVLNLPYTKTKIIMLNFKIESLNEIISMKQNKFEIIKDIRLMRMLKSRKL